MGVRQGWSQDWAGHFSFLARAQLAKPSICSIRTLNSRSSPVPAHGTLAQRSPPHPDSPISRKQPLSAYFVLLGSISSYPQAGEPQELRAVAQFIKHPEYWEENNRADVALVRLAAPVTFTDLILPVCLPKPGDSLGHGTWCWVTGWGNVATNLRKDTLSVWQVLGGDQC